MISVKLWYKSCFTTNNCILLSTSPPTEIRWCFSFPCINWRVSFKPRARRDVNLTVITAGKAHNTWDNSVIKSWWVLFLITLLGVPKCTAMDIYVDCRYVHTSIAIYNLPHTNIFHWRWLIIVLDIVIVTVVSFTLLLTNSI